MKIKNTTIGLLLSVFLLSSCEEWFDVSASTNVKQGDLFKTEAGFRDVLSGVYALMSTNVLYGRELTYGFNDVRAQYWAIAKSTHSYYGASVYDYEADNEKVRIKGMWNKMYKCIANLNSIIENIDSRKDVFTGKNYYLCKGEALGLRAMLHFDLLRLWGPSPAAKNAMETLSIPYYTKTTKDSQELLPMKSVIEKIEEDLIAARNEMKDYDCFGPKWAQYESEYETRLGRMNYWGATALLARLFLYKGEKLRAFNYASEIVNGKPNREPANPMFFVGSAESDKLLKREIIFNLQVSKMKDYSEFSFGLEAAVDGSTTGLLNTTEKLLNVLYKQVSAGDSESRAKGWIRDAGGKLSTMSKYDEQQSVPLIRISEMYYIASETIADKELALSYLNKLRGARNLVALDFNTDLTIQIEIEYQKEFLGEGQLYYYYKRMGASKIGLEGKSVTLESYILPLTEEEKSFGNIE